MKSKIVFLVGCSRSGTTLLQSLLAAHPEVVSFPESKFFWYAVPLFEAKRLRFGIASRRLKPELKKFFQEIGYPEYRLGLPVLPATVGQYTRLFFNLMDQITQSQGRKVFLEKTPEHLRYLDYIERLLPNAKIIHILRDGKDVIASLYDLSKRYPNRWGLGYDSLDTCIDYWIQSVEISRKYTQNQNHFIVRYDHLTSQPEYCLRELFRFIGLDFQESILYNYQQVGEKLIREQEKDYKIKVCEPIQEQSLGKFSTVLDREQQEYVLSRICSFALDKIFPTQVA